MSRTHQSVPAALTWETSENFSLRKGHVRDTPYIYNNDKLVLHYGKSRRENHPKIGCWWHAYMLKQIRYPLYHFAVFDGCEKKKNLKSSL